MIISTQLLTLHRVLFQFTKEGNSGCYISVAGCGESVNWMPQVTYIRSMTKYRLFKCFRHDSYTGRF